MHSNESHAIHALLESNRDRTEKWSTFFKVRSTLYIITFSPDSILTFSKVYIRKPSRFIAWPCLPFLLSLCPSIRINVNLRNHVSNETLNEMRCLGRASSSDGQLRQQSTSHQSTTRIRSLVDRVAFLNRSSLTTLAPNKCSNAFYTAMLLLSMLHPSIHLLRVCYLVYLSGGNLQISAP